MPVIATCGKKSYEGERKGRHAEQKLFASGRHDEGNITIYLNGWPCVGDGILHSRHDCHKLLKQKSTGRIITVIIDGDQGGYVACHSQAVGETGTITYNDGDVTYS